MIPQKLSERLAEMGQSAEKIYSIRTVKAGLEGKREVPWMKGFFFKDVDSASDSEYENSWIQDAASFVPVIALNPQPGESVWDMAAAPGMKTALIGKLMENQGHIVATEVDRHRMMRLKNNIRRLGCEMCETIRCDASRFKSQELFDKILLDAPCSGEGMVTKQKKLFKIWSEKRILRLQKTQKKMIEHGFKLLKPGGTLVYSTCTFGPEENEQVVEWLFEKHNAIVEKIEIPEMNFSRGIDEWKSQKFLNSDKFVRIWPYQNNTNGMFVARLKKKL